MFFQKVEKDYDVVYVCASEFFKWFKHRVYLMLHINQRVSVSHNDHVLLLIFSIIYYR